MNLAEDFVKSVIGYAVKHCADDLAFLQNRLIDEEKSKPQAERSPMPLLEKLDFVVNNDFQRLTYTEAIEIFTAIETAQGKEISVSRWLGYRPAI
jgi:asparaginyl-tRNA synthetase